MNLFSIPFFNLLVPGLTQPGCVTQNKGGILVARFTCIDPIRFCQEFREYEQGIGERFNTQAELNGAALDIEVLVCRNHPSGTEIEVTCLLV